MDLPIVLNWAVALAPVLILLLAFEWLDVFHLIHIRAVMVLLALGVVAGLIAYPISGRVLDTLPLGFSVYSRFVAPWLEEALKGAMVVWLFARNRIGFKLDAAISGFAIGAGFSVFENCIYLLDPNNAHYSTGVWMVRGLGTAVMHGGATALFAVLAHQLNEGLARDHEAAWRLRFTRFVPGFLVAVAIHSAFNQFPDRPLIAMIGALLVLPMAIILVFRFGEQEARKWLAEETVSHRVALDELRSGSFPATASGRLVEALASRANGSAPPELIREYLEVHTELVLRAEEMMGDQANGAAHPLGAADRALFKRLGDLRERLGRTTLAMLAPLLPFSREELWEMDELRQRLHGR